MQCLIHLQGREAYIDAIHVGDEIANADEREQAEAGFAQCSAGEGFFFGGCR
jgi:hypothetical protein